MFVMVATLIGEAHTWRTLVNGSHETFTSLLNFSCLLAYTNVHKCLSTLYFIIHCSQLKNIKLLCEILYDHSASFTYPNSTKVFESPTQKMKLMSFLLLWVFIYKFFSKDISVSFYVKFYNY